MVIQELKPSQRIKGRWLAVLEDGTILRVGERDVAEYALYSGKELSDAEVQALLASVKRNGLIEKTLVLLARKPQSRQEVERKLVQWEANAEEIAAICDRMEELGYLNDEDYAVRVVRYYAGKGYGERRLRDELYRRGVPRIYWEDALMHVSHTENILDGLLEKKLAGKSVDEKALKKASDALIRRGFSWSEVREAVERFQRHLNEF